MRSLVLLAVVVVLLLAGCSQASSVAPAKVSPTRATETPVDPADSVMRDILGKTDDAVATEPAGDVSRGVFLGHITSVVTSPVPAFEVDFVTPDMQPGVTKEQRERSSWPDYFGWNRFKHRQRFGAGYASLITGGMRFEPVSFEQFAREYASDQDSASLNYYILVRGHEIDAVWPWQP
jgi:hypothetical protein